MGNPHLSSSKWVEAFVKVATQFIIDIMSERAVGHKAKRQQREEQEQEQRMDDVGLPPRVPEEEPPKRTRPTFTDRAKNDVVTLPLVMSFLDVYSLCRSRRVCSVWQLASRRAVAWRNTVLAVNIEWFLDIPLSSIQMLRHVTLVRDLKAPLPDLAQVFIRLGSLAGLQSLRLEELVVDTGLCDLISSYLPGLRALDLKMCNEHVSEQMETQFALVMAERQRQAIAEEKAEEAAEESPAARMVAALEWLEDTDEEQMPELDLPQLHTLKLCYSVSLKHSLYLVQQLSGLRTLQMRRKATTDGMLDTPRTEGHFIEIMNDWFRHRAGDSLQHLTLTNMHFHPFSRFEFERLGALTHLALVQNSNFQGTTTDLLRRLAAMKQLQQVVLKVGNAAIGACLSPDWWEALARIESLTSFTYWNPNTSSILVMTADQLAIVTKGLRQVVANCRRLEYIQLSQGGQIDDSVLEIVSGAHSLRSVALYNASVTIAGLDHLAQLPLLVELELISCRGLHTGEGLVAIVQKFPGLESLSFRLPSVVLSKDVVPHAIISDEAWMQLPRLTKLVRLHLSGYGRLSAQVVQSWCQQAEAGFQARMVHDQLSLRRFSGFEDEAVAQIAAPRHTGVSWQEMRCSGWMVTNDLAGQLLARIPQLQVLSVHLLPTSDGAFHTMERHQPRMLLAGGDFMQRQIASYLGEAGVFD